jgi:hypothetical protein
MKFFAGHKGSDAKPEPTPKKVRTKIAKLSPKRKLQNDVYLKLRKMYLDAKPNCEVMLVGCTFNATEIHHAEGRIGKLLTDINNFVAICRNCHVIVENQNLKTNP